MLVADVEDLKRTSRVIRENAKHEIFFAALFHLVLPWSLPHVTTRGKWVYVVQRVRLAIPHLSDAAGV